MADDEVKTSARLPPYEPPADNHLIVWIENQGRPAVLAIFNEVVEPSATTQRDTYRAFVQRFGPQAAETAIRLYRLERRLDD